MAAVSPRWGMFRSISAAVRATTAPGSPGVRERLACLPRLLQATRRGAYRGTTTGRLLLLLAAVLYVVSPVDLVPELPLALLGLGDDALVVSWIAVTLVNETEQFLAWERSRTATVSGSVLR